MSRAFYSEYVNHCMRFYARHDRPAKFRSEADKQNWLACDSALKTFSEGDRFLLLTIYQEGDTVADTIYKMAKSHNVSQDVIWRLVGDLERKVAKRRGLL